MYHLHFKKCHSTQIYLKDNIDNLLTFGEKILVSTEHQTSGVGRTGNSWIQLENALAFSFTLKPAATLTLTPLEVGILISEFLEKTFKVKPLLKWPNDLMTGNNEKCGGIMMHFHKDNTVLVGVGLNLGKFSGNPTSQHFNHTPSSLTQKTLAEDEYKKIPYALVDYIHGHRIKDEYIKNSWLALCTHKNKRVEIIESTSSKIEGEFIGLGTLGEAVIKDKSGDEKEFISGSLKIL